MGKDNLRRGSLIYRSGFTSSFRDPINKTTKEERIKGIS